MTTRKRKRFEIIAGPSKLDLMFALFDYQSDPREVTFCFPETPHLTPSDKKQRSNKRPVIIVGLEQDFQYSDNGDVWSFKGIVRYPHRYVHGEYNTRTREGWLEPGKYLKVEE